MKGGLAFLLTLLSLSRVQCLHEDECITGFSVVAPEIAVPGKTTAVFITLNGLSAPSRTFNVTLRLLDNSQISQNNLNAYNQALIETTHEIKGHGILPLKVPADASGSCLLQTLINCTVTAGREKDRNHCGLRSSSEMRLVGPVRDVIVRPASHTYRPGETLLFWILALNHDLQIAMGAIGSVSVKDPQGTKVAIWDQVALDEGVKSFSLPLSPYALIGRWVLQVDVDQAEFFVAVEVTPNTNWGLPDVAVAEEHYVELRFSNEMRRRYKPGLPFAGKVQAMSTEKSVRVRVKVFDNTTCIYSQDIEISNGEGTFIVPSIMADSDTIALQAELVSVDSKEIESHYVLARESIQKWNSSSDCYLLIEDMEHTLQPNEKAHVTILSTCSCDNDMQLAITTDGQITYWIDRNNEQNSIMELTNGGNHCKIKFNFTVKSIMAPVSQLLIYYVTPQGEPVSDIISFHVKLIEPQVSVNLEEREWWLPDQYIDVEVIAAPSSLVCLLGGRDGVNGDIRFDPRISEDKQKHSIITGEVDFLEAGVSFYQQQCARRGDSGASIISFRQRGSGAGPSKRSNGPPESLVGGAPFDQLWMWRCFNTTSEVGSTKVSINAPKDAGRWSVWALTVSKAGLRFSVPTHIEVFRPLEVEFRLPSSMRVRETLEVDIKIGNNLNSCVDVTALLALSEGAQFVNNGLLYVTERLRLGPRGATSLVVRILVTTAGMKNFTVEVNGYTSLSCEGIENSDNSTLSGAVVHSATVKVLPEGIVRSHTESAYFCANENVIVSTTDNYKYEWIPSPRNRENIVIEIKTNSYPVYIALAESKTKLDKMYRITIGDAGNTMCHIERGKYNYGIQLASITMPNILALNDWTTFSISWHDNVISFGNGSELNNMTLLKWRMDKKFKVRYIGFASAWGNLAEFRIWNNNDEAGFSQVLHLDTPKKVVPGSERGKLVITGGISVPSLKYIEGYGLSEALASLTPTLPLQHLHLSTNDSSREEIANLLPPRIQSILSFRKEDNSFSPHPMLGSHKATVSILEALSKVQLYFSIDPELIQSIKRWVQLRQEDDGRFTPLDADVKISLSSCSNSRKNLTDEAIIQENIVEITAETIISLYEIGIQTDADSDAIQKAKIFIENSLPNIELPETIAAVALALVLVRSATAAWAIEKLRNASTTEDGEFGWTHFVPKKDAADWLYESETGKILKEPLAATVEEYKASIYALSTFCIIGDLRTAESVSKFLFYRSHMLDNHYDLFYPAVKAFSKYDALTRDRHRSLVVSLATSGMELTDTLELNKNRQSQTLYLPSLPTKVFVYATGAGCATVQGKIAYSTYAAKNKTPLLEIGSEILEELQSESSSVEEIDGKLPMLKVKTCFKWKGSKPSPILRLDVALFSGFELTSIPPQLLNPPQEMAEMQHSTHDNKLWLTFANISTSCPVCVQYSIRSPFVISSARPAYARIYPSSREDLAAETFFHSQSKSSLLSSVTTDDLVTWFGTNENGNNQLDISKECREKEFSGPSATILVEKIADPMFNLSTSATNIFEDSKKLELTKTESMSSGDNPSNHTVAPSILKIIEQTKSLKRHFEMVSLLSDTENVQEPAENITTLDILPTSTESNPSSPSDINATSSWTHQTLTSTPTTVRAPIAPTVILRSTASPRYINTEQIHNIPRRMLIEKDETLFNPDIKNYQYVLLNKDALWSMLKEAVSDEFKRNDVSNALAGSKKEES
ncbi:C3 and PZP-like alpha-2-macroglobulin domain-containing protein 8 [Cylas formicarius]|uniref:C3 and PZP-like alpha-2-macroglobulin domain-containing protein 8 n=1 Tax=Cylas formicarius TaxID=197179 RepID=UPI0029588025|nr:C3 and PZP-like alpha-2-macroglobulin domain-containing protein 8 [Cylas formicarius]